MRTNLIKLAGVAFIASVISACAVNETATVEVGPDGTKQIIESNSGLLAASLEIVDNKVGYSGDLLRVQATIKNDSRSALSFRYKFKWLDKDGFEVAVDGRPWTPLTITPYESKSVQALAPNPTVKAFKILVQD
ncbi:MAG: hypothetical protein C9356_06850 [Oleiphilus sp.]|nr:MAG: hypothetical protein C9356_06850 [Oleiphilus sp.]